MDRVTSPSFEANICVKPSLAPASHTSFIPAAGVSKARDLQGITGVPLKFQSGKHQFNVFHRPKKLPRWRSTGAGHGSQPRPWGAPTCASSLEKHDSSSLSWEIKRTSSLLMAEPRRACSAQHSHFGVIFSSDHTGVLREQSSHLSCEQWVQLKAFGSPGAQQLNSVPVHGVVQLPIVTFPWLRGATGDSSSWDVNCSESPGG